MNKNIILSLALCLGTVSGFSQQRLTLEQCLDSARRYNHDLHLAEKEITAARDQKKEAFTKFFPQIQANVAAFQIFERLGKSYTENNGSGDGSLTLNEDQVGNAKNIVGILLGLWDTNLDYLTGAQLGYSGNYTTTTSTSGFNRVITGTVSAIQPVFMGGRIINGNKLASLGIDVAELKHVIKESDVLQKVTECYWRIATIKYNLNTIEAAEKQIAAVKKRVQDLVGNGVITGNNLLQVNLREQELASTRLKLENGDQLLRMLLAQQIGVTEGEVDIILPDDNMEPTLPVYAGDNSSESRAELELAQKGIDAEKLKLRIERGKLLPTLAAGVVGIGLGHNFDGASGYVKGNANLNIDLTNTTFQEMFPQPLVKNYDYSIDRPIDLSDRIKKGKFTGFVMATLSVPISDWWGGYHALHRQKVRVEQAQETYQDAREKLALDNKSAWLKVTEAYKQIAIAKSSVEQARENLRMYTDQYENGTITITDLLDAETLNRKAQNQLSSSLADYQVSLANYQRKVTK